MDMLCHYSGEVSVDVLCYDLCLDAVAVVGLSIARVDGWTGEFKLSWHSVDLMLGVRF